jgi:hypothetical protein
MDPNEQVEDPTKFGESDTDLPKFDDGIIYFESETGRWLSNGEWVTNCHTIDYTVEDGTDENKG